MIRVCIAALFALLPLSAAAQTVWRYSNWLPPTHPVTTGVVQVWAKQVQQATRGRVRIEVLSALGAPPAHFDLVRNGVADASSITTSYTAGRFPLLKGLELPFLSNSNFAMSVAAQRTYDKFFAQANEFRGVKVIGLALVGPYQVYTTKKPVSVMDDFKGIKLREAGGITQEVAELIGATPFFAPAPQTYDVLARGVCDGVLFPPESIPGFKVTGVIRHGLHVPGGFHQSVHAFIVNEAKWKALSAEDQAAVSKLTGEHLARLWGGLWDQTNAGAVEQMRKEGVQIHDASAALLAELHKRLATLETDWLADAAKKGVDGKAALAYLREQVRELERK